MDIGDLRTGAEQQQLSVLNTLENWKTQNLQKVQQASQAIGVTQAKKDLASEEAEFKADFGISRKAYNNAVSSSYIQSAKTDLSEELNAIAAANSNNLQMYNDLSAKAIESAIKNADPYISDELALEADLINSSYRKQVQGNAIKRNMKAAQDEISNAIKVKADNALGMLANSTNDEDIGAAALKITEAIKLIDSQDHLSEAQKDIQKETLAKGFAEQSFLNPILKAETSEQAYAALEEMEKVPAGWSPSDWEKVTGKGLAHANRLARQEADALKLNVKMAEAEALLERGSVLFENGIAIDPYKTTEGAKYDYKAINSYYDNTYTQEISQLPLLDQLNANTAFVQRTGIIPEQLETRLNAFTRSGDVTQAGVAADQIARIQEVSPQALKDLPAETKAIALMVTDAMRSGSDVAATLEAARISNYGMTEAQKEAISLKTKEYDKDLSSKLSGLLDDDFDRWDTFGAPDAPPVMEAEYKVNFDKYMILTDGNADQAEKLAYNDLKNVWAVSDITGGFMKYAPESVYAVPGIDSDWMKDQFEEETTGLNNPTIVVDAATARNPRPEYKLMQETETGILEPVYDENNMPQVWVPDYAETKEFKEFQNQPTAIEKAKIQRERNKVQNMNQKTKIINARLKNEDLETALNNALALGEINEIEAEQLRAYYADKN